MEYSDDEKKLKKLKERFAEGGAGSLNLKEFQKMMHLSRVIRERKVKTHG